MLPNGGVRGKGIVSGNGGGEVVEVTERGKKQAPEVGACIAIAW